MTTLFLRIVATSLGRWLLGGGVALLLSLGVYKWHSFKEDLIHQGQQVCVQEINKQTVLDLQAALVAEQAVSAQRAEMITVIAEANASARARLNESESRVGSLLAEKKEQEKTDETYAAWSNSALPDGVADRLRDAAPASNTGAVRNDGT